MSPTDMPQQEFNPSSTDAVLSAILTEMKQHKELLQEIREGQVGDRSRITALEREHWYQRGIVAVISVVAVTLWNYVTGK